MGGPVFVRCMPFVFLCAHSSAGLTRIKDFRYSRFRFWFFPTMPAKKNFLRKKPAAKAASDQKRGVKMKQKCASTEEGKACWREKIPGGPETIGDNLRGWRDAIANLDIAVPHSVCINGKWKSLDPDDLKVCYERRRDHMKGEVVMADWYNALPKDEQTSMSGKIIKVRFEPES